MTASVTPPTILAIETATSSCSVALLHDGQINTLDEVGNNIHSGVLLGMVDKLLSSTGIVARQLDAVAVGQGPGSFTGLRIGVGVAQGLAYGAGCKMIGVSSLDILARSFAKTQDSALGSHTVLAGIDARMGEIYWAEYRLENQRLMLMDELRVTAPHEVCSSAQNIHLIGNAWGEYWDELDDEFRSKALLDEELIYPRAAALLDVAIEMFAEGDLIEVASFKPIYVRDNVAKKSTKPLPGTRI